MKSLSDTLFGSKQVAEPNLPSVVESRKPGEYEIGDLGEEYDGGKLKGALPDTVPSDVTDEQLDKAIDRANESLGIRGLQQYEGSTEPDMVAGHEERMKREEKYLDMLFDERDRRTKEKEEKKQAENKADTDHERGSDSNKNANKDR